MIQIDMQPPKDRSLPESVKWADKTMLNDFPVIHRRFHSYRNRKRLDELELSQVLAVAHLQPEQEKHFVFLFKSFCNVKDVEIFSEKEDKSSKKIKNQGKVVKKYHTQGLRRSGMRSKKSGSGHAPGM